MEELSLLGLAISAFTSATLLPGTSEAALALMIVTSGWGIAVLVAVASMANIAGSTINWALGRATHRYHGTRFWPVSAEQQARAEAWYSRYGWWSLLASWVPIIGDPLTLVAGIMREPIGRFLLVVGFAKTVRYCVIAAAAYILAFGFPSSFQ